MAFYYVGMNAVLFLLMGIDKWLAIRGDRRVAERTLFALAILGGSAGGFIGMFFFHHKTKKRIFYVVFIMAILLHSYFFYLIFMPHFSYL